MIPQVDSFGFTEDYSGAVRIDSMMIRTAVDPRDPRYDQVLGDGYYLVVGESPETMYGTSQAEPNFQLLVTKDGVAVNASPTEWNSEYDTVAADGAVGVGSDSTYSLFVNGPVKIKGTLTVLGDIVFGNIRGQAGAVGSGSSFWYAAADTATQTTVYTPNLVAIGPRDWAQASRHRLAVIGNANYDQDQIQLAVNNRQGAGGRIGVVSDVAGAPWVFAPFAGCAIEMYGADAVDRTYTGGRKGLGALYDVSNGLATFPEGTFVPSLKVAPSGTVLVHAVSPQTMTWTSTWFDATAGAYVTESATRAPELQVAGAIAADAVLVRDMDGVLKNIRDIFPDRDSDANELVPAGRVVNTVPGKEGFVSGRWTFGAGAPAADTAVVLRGALPEGDAALTVRSGSVFVEGEVRATRGVFEALELTGAQTFDFGDGSDLRAGTIEVTHQFVYRGQTVNFSVADPDFDPSAMFSFQGSYAATNYRLRIGGAVHPFLRPGVLSMWNDGAVAGHTATFAFRADPALAADYVQEAHVGHLARAGDAVPADGIFEVPFAVVTRPGFGGVRAPFAVFPENTRVASSATVQDDVPTVLAYAGRFGVNVASLGEFGEHEVYLNGTVFGREFHTPAGRMVGFAAAAGGIQVAADDGAHVGIRGAPDARYPVRLAGDVLFDGGLYNASGKRLGWWDMELTSNTRSSGTVKTHMHVGIGAVPESEYSLDIRSPDTGGATAIRLLRGETDGVRVTLENTGSALAEMRLGSDLSFFLRDAVGHEFTPLTLSSGGARLAGNLTLAPGAAVAGDLEVRGAVTATAFRIRGADGETVTLDPAAAGIDVSLADGADTESLYLRGYAVDLSFARTLTLRDAAVTPSQRGDGAPLQVSTGTAAGRVAHFENVSGTGVATVSVAAASGRDVSLGVHGGDLGSGVAVGGTAMVRMVGESTTVVVGAGAGDAAHPSAVQIAALPGAASPVLSAVVRDSPAEVGATLLLEDVSAVDPWAWRVRHGKDGVWWERTWQTPADPDARARAETATGGTSLLAPPGGALPAATARLVLPPGTAVTVSIAGTALQQTYQNPHAGGEVHVDVADAGWDTYATGSVPVTHRVTTLAHDAAAGRLACVSAERPPLSATVMDGHEFVLAAASGARLLLAAPAAWEGGGGAGVFLKTSPGGEFGATAETWDFAVRADGARLRVQGAAAGAARDLLVLDPAADEARVAADVRVQGSVDASGGFYINGNMVMGATQEAMLFDRDIELRPPASHLRFTLADVANRPFVQATEAGTLALGSDLPDAPADPAEASWAGPATLPEPAPAAGTLLQSAFGAGGTVLATVLSGADLVRVYVRPDVHPVGEWAPAQELAIPGARSVAANGNWLAVVSVQLGSVEVYRWTGSWYRHERSVLAANDDGILEVPEDVAVLGDRLLAALASSRGGWRAWDLASGGLVAGSPADYGGVRKLAVSVWAPSRLVTVGIDGGADLWEEVADGVWEARAAIGAGAVGAAMSGSRVVLSDAQGGVRLLRVGADVPGWHEELATGAAGGTRVGATRQYALAESPTAILAWRWDGPTAVEQLAPAGVSAGDGFGTGFAAEETRELVAATAVDAATATMSHVFWERLAVAAASVNLELSAAETVLRKPAVLRAGMTVLGGDLVHVAGPRTLVRSAATGHVSFHAAAPRAAPYGGAHPFDVASGFVLGDPTGTVQNELLGPATLRVAAAAGGTALDVEAAGAGTALLRVASAAGGGLAVAAGGATEVDVPEDAPGAAGLTVRMGRATRTALLLPGGAEVTAEGRTYLGPGAAAAEGAAAARLVVADGDALFRAASGAALRVFSAGVVGPERLLTLADAGGGGVLDARPDGLGVFAEAAANLAALRVGRPAGAAGDVARFEGDGTVRVAASGAVAVEVQTPSGEALLRVADAAASVALALEENGALAATADLHLTAHGGVAGRAPLRVTAPAGTDLLRLTPDGDLFVRDAIELAASEGAVAVGAAGVPRGADTLPQAALTVHPIPDAVAPGADSLRAHSGSQDAPALQVDGQAATQATAVVARDLAVPCADAEGRAAAAWAAVLDAAGTAAFAPALDAVTEVSRAGALRDASGAVLFRAAAAGPLPRPVRGVASFADALGAAAAGLEVVLRREEAAAPAFRVRTASGATRLAAGARGVELQGLRMEVPEDAPDTCYVM